MRTSRYRSAPRPRGGRSLNTLTSSAQGGGLLPEALCADRFSIVYERLVRLAGLSFIGVAVSTTDTRDDEDIAATEARLHPVGGAL
jgi:hypothetical protein